MDNKDSYTNSSIKNIHDKFFRDIFSDPQVSVDLFKHHLPPKIFKKIDLKSLRLTNKSFVNEEYADKHSDLVYKAKVDGGQGYLYLLAEASIYQ